MCQSKDKDKGEGIKVRTSTERGTVNEPHHEGGSATKKKGRRKKSNVWDHFAKYVNEEGETKGKCNYCTTEYFADTKRNGTSSLWAHLTLQPIPEGGDGNLGSLATWKFDQELCRKKLNEMIVKDELPFRLVEGEGFREFVKSLQPKFKLTSRWTISRDIYQCYLNEREKLRDFFSETGLSICITTDTWTSLQKLNYMCITAHYIEKDWKLNKKITNFKKCLETLKTRLSSRGCTLVKGKYLHMRCMAHIIALVVSDGLKEIGKSIDRIRGAVKFVRQSLSRLVKFKECCKVDNIETKSLLCLDVPTRWNSTYLMLSVASKLEKAFDQYAVKDPFFMVDLDDGVPDALDWENGRRMSDLLETFYDLTVRVSGSLYVTCNEFLHEITSVSEKPREWITSEDEDIRSMGEKMREKFDKYWGDPTEMNQIIFLSVVIDPRYKLEFLEFVLVEEWGEYIRKKMCKTVLDSLHELYDAYKLQHQPATAASVQIQTSKKPEASSSARNRVMAEKYKKQKAQTRAISAINELDIYCKENVVTAEDGFDILLWWKLNQHRFPILSLLARDLLAVPISTVASESTFSTGGRFLDTFRSSLTPKLVESLICSQDWLKRSKEQITVEEDLDALFKHEEGLKAFKITDDNEVVQVGKNQTPSEIKDPTPMET